MASIDTFSSLTDLSTTSREYKYFDIVSAANSIGFDVDLLPNSVKILFENLLRNEDGISVSKDDISLFGEWIASAHLAEEVSYYPARVLMQDFTGVPAVVDLAAMREAAKAEGNSPSIISPIIPVDLVIDHSIQVDKYGIAGAMKQNTEIEIARNKERYQFLKWGQSAFDNFRVVPPGTGICHQVNLEYLAKVIWSRESEGVNYAYPDTLVGTDSHTTMINGLSVLGWGVGGIEAEACMLGQPISMLLPDVIGVNLTGELPEGTTATDLVLTVTHILRAKGVVGKFVEFYGDGLDNLSLADRATISNMAPEYGATCGFFPTDDETIRYLELSGRDTETIELVKAYAKKQHMWRDPSTESKMHFSDHVEISLAEVEACLAGPKRPQDKVILGAVSSGFSSAIGDLSLDESNLGKSFPVPSKDYSLKNGDVVISAITSCTNTSNPSVMIAAGIMAKNAVAKGISVKPWVKTSLAPGSKVVSEYLDKSGLQKYLDDLGYNVVGYGCTTCIGNSGPLMEEISKTIQDNKLVVASVLSGNRNFEGRVHPDVRANYLASPPLCVAYAIAGSVEVDIKNNPIAQDARGNDVYLKRYLAF